jgi:hypothetical protein
VPRIRADVNVYGGHFGSALQAAASRNPIRYASPHGSTPPHIMVETLLKAGADINDSTPKVVSTAVL